MAFPGAKVFQVQNKTFYEHPLNEKIRTFLRLEFLFQQVHYYLAGQSPWENRVVLSSLIDIHTILEHTDLKGDLIKELDRHHAHFAQWSQNPNINTPKLEGILHELTTLSKELKESKYQLGRQLKNHPLLNSIRQRHSIPGGSCEFDLPAYHHWLQQTPETRIVDLERWLQPFVPILRAASLSLMFIRRNTPFEAALAENGAFQKPLVQDPACQLIRIALPSHTPLYPEICGGKHRFTLRFMQQNFESPQQTTDTIEFELACCAF